MKSVDGAKLFSIGPAVPPVPPNLSETGETSFIFGYTRLHNVFQVGITNVPIATEASATQRPTTPRVSTDRSPRKAMIQSSPVTSTPQSLL